jgi:LPS sulfotransferase NodH
VQRSGTHLLGSILRGTNVAGRPGEYLFCKRSETWEGRWDTPSRAAYLERVFRQGTTRNGVFGCVVMWTYFERMIQMLHEIPAYQQFDRSEVLCAVFNRLKYIWMRRRDRVQQAVSWVIAAQTQIWSQKPGDAAQPDAPLHFDFESIDQRYHHISSDEQSWENYFRQNAIEPLVLFYEDVAQSNRAAAEGVLDFLGVPVPSNLELPPPTVEKQATAVSEEWAARYRELKAKTDAKIMTKHE